MRYDFNKPISFPLFDNARYFRYIILRYLENSEQRIALHFGNAVIVSFLKLVSYTWAVYRIRKRTLAAVPYLSSRGIERREYWI